MSVEVRYYTDPACSWSWGAEPLLRRLIWEFDGELDFVLVMGGLARRYGTEYRDEEGAIGSGSDCFADLMSHWLNVAGQTGMPCDPRLWTTNPIDEHLPGLHRGRGGRRAGLGGRPTATCGACAKGCSASGASSTTPARCWPRPSRPGSTSPASRSRSRSHAAIESFSADIEEVRRDPRGGARRRQAQPDRRPRAPLLPLPRLRRRRRRAPRRLGLAAARSLPRGGPRRRRRPGQQRPPGAARRGRPLRPHHHPRGRSPRRERPPADLRELWRLAAEHGLRPVPRPSPGRSGSPLF